MAISRSGHATSRNSPTHAHFSSDLHDAEHPTFDPVLSKYKCSLHPSETRFANDTTYSSSRMSPSHSFFLAQNSFQHSPKHSDADTFLFSDREIEAHFENELSLRLEDKLKYLEMKHKEVKNHEKMTEEVNLDKTVWAKEAEIEFQGEGDLRVPQLKWCAGCAAEVMTQVEYVNNEKTFWTSVGIFLSGGVFGCFLLPYMMNSCKGARLVCHRCKRVIY
jgi:hypothetical protein